MDTEQNKPPWTRDCEDLGYHIFPALVPPERWGPLMDLLEAHAQLRLGPKDGPEHGIAARAGLRDLLWTVPEVAEIVNWPEIVQVILPLLGAESCLVRALWFDKTPVANWRVTWHQDLTIAVAAEVSHAPGYRFSHKGGVPHAQPPVTVLEQMVALRLHGDDQGPDNGPLEVLPATHQLGRLDQASIANLHATRTAVSCATPRGGGVVMRPLLLHASPLARVPRRRRVLHLEFSATPNLPDGVRWFHPVPVKVPS